MKKTLVFLLILYSSFANAEWITLSCNNALDQSLILEFDQEKQKIRIDGDNNKIKEAKITDLKIEWTTTRGELWNEIDRLSGIYRRPSAYPKNPPNEFCVVTKKKF